MRDGASRLFRRAADVASSPEARDADRLASGLFLLVTGSGVAAGLLWAIGYALLGRPLSAVSPASPRRRVMTCVSRRRGLRALRSRTAGQSSLPGRSPTRSAPHWAL